LQGFAHLCCRFQCEAHRPGKGGVPICFVQVFDVVPANRICTLRRDGPFMPTHQTRSVGIQISMLQGLSTDAQCVSTFGLVPRNHPSVNRECTTIKRTSSLDGMSGGGSSAALFTKGTQITTALRRNLIHSQTTQNVSAALPDFVLGRTMRRQQSRNRTDVNPLRNARAANLMRNRFP